MPSGIRWLSATMIEGYFKNLDLFKSMGQHKVTQKRPTVLPISLYTRILEITPQGQIEHFYLLPFLDRYTHIQRYEIPHYRKDFCIDPLHTFDVKFHHPYSSINHI